MSRPGTRQFVRREIETPPGDGDRLRVVRGLSPGDRVVSDGVLLLRRAKPTDQNSDSPHHFGRAASADCSS